MKESSSPPYVSVIVPCRNEEKFIEGCLSSLFDQDYPSDYYEIVVVDGVSSDASLDKVKQYSSNRNNIRVISNAKMSAPSGSNLGIKEAKGEIIVRVDAHAKVEKDFISQSVKYLKQTDADCVGGPIETKGSGYLGEAIALVLGSPFGTGSRFRYSKKDGYVDTVPFGAYKSEAFKKYGLLDEGLERAEDLELNHRIIKKGGRIFIASEIRSCYFCRSNIRDLLKQNFLNGVDVIRAARKDASAVSIRHLIPMFFILSLLGSLGLSVISVFSPVIFGFIAGLYLAFNIWFSAAIAINKGIRYLVVLPVLFLLLHLSYGFGSVFGLIKIKP